MGHRGVGGISSGPGIRPHVFVTLNCEFHICFSVFFYPPTFGEIRWLARAKVGYSILPCAKLELVTVGYFSYPGQIGFDNIPAG